MSLDHGFGSLDERTTQCRKFIGVLLASIVLKIEARGRVLMQHCCAQVKLRPRDREGNLFAVPGRMEALPSEDTAALRLLV